MKRYELKILTGSVIKMERKDSIEECMDTIKKYTGTFVISDTETKLFKVISNLGNYYCSEWAEVKKNQG